MKSFRTFVLLLLMLLLPLRGAVAATLLCGTTGENPQATVALHDDGVQDPGAHDHGGHDQGAHDHGAHDHGAHDHGAHDHGAHDHGAHDHGAHDHGGHDHGAHALHADTGDGEHAAAPQHDGDGQTGHAERCHLCASGCHATPLATAAPQVPAPHLTARLVFPHLSVAAPAFQSDAQERPPRSL